jgi:hypothetical protein
VVAMIYTSMGYIYISKTVSRSSPSEIPVLTYKVNFRETKKRAKRLGL